MHWTSVAIFCLAVQVIQGKTIKDNEATSNMTVKEVLKKHYKQYYELIQSVYLHTMFEDREVTVFAFSDETFNNFPEEKKVMLKYDLSAVYSMVLYQVVLGKAIMSSFFQDGLFLLTGLHNKVFVNIMKRNGKKELWLQGKRILKTDVIAKKGIIHEINGTLTPPVSTLKEYLRQKGHYENFLTALQRAQMLLPVGFTVFAPPDSSFWKIPERKRIFLLGNRESNKELASMHIVPKTVFTSLIGETPLTIPTIHRRYITLKRVKAGIELTLHKKENQDAIEPILIQDRDIPVQNGIVHTIGDFIRPGLEPVTISQKLWDMNLTRISKAIEKSGFETFLSYRSSVFTVLAPIDKVFDTMTSISNSPILSDRIVRFHIIPGKILVRNLRKFSEVQTMSGDMMMLRKFGAKSMAAKGLIIKPDIEVENGVIHLVDRVLFPRTDSVAYGLAVQPNPKTSTFLHAMTLAGLSPLMNNRRRFPNMFWVPSDEAFNNLPLQSQRYLFSNTKLLRKVLRYHIVPGFFYSRLMVHKWVYLFRTRLRGATLRVRSIARDSPKMIVYNPVGKTAQTLFCDFGAINGVVNIIDQVLFPAGLEIPGVTKRTNGASNNIARSRA